MEGGTYPPHRLGGKIGRPEQFPWQLQLGEREKEIVNRVRIGVSGLHAYRKTRKFLQAHSIYKHDYRLSLTGMLLL